MKKGILICVVVVVLLVLIGGGLFWFYQNTGSKLLSKATLAMKANRFDKALELTNKYISSNPKDWNGYYTQATVYYTSTRYEEARKSLEQAIKLAPGEASPQILLAQSHVADGRKMMGSKRLVEIQQGLDKFATAMQVLSKTKPGNDRQWLDVQQEVGLEQIEYARALQWHARQLEEDAVGAEARRDVERVQKLRAQIKASSAKVEELLVGATKNLLQVVSREPSRDVAASRLIELCLERQDNPSLASARKAILAMEDPTPVAAMMLVMNELTSSGSADSQGPVNRQKLLAACSVLDDILKKHPDNVQVMLARAELMMRLRDQAQASEMCDRILKLEPRNPRARLAKAELLILQNNLADAEKTLVDLKHDYPNWPDAHMAYARVALATGKTSMAQEALQAMSKIDSVSPRSKLMQAELALILQDVETARQLSEDVLRSQPGNQWARLVHGNALAVSGDLGPAERELKMLVKDYPKWPQAQLALSQVAAQTGSSQAAIAAAQAAVELDPENSAAKQRLAGLLLREGQFDQAFLTAQATLQSHSDDPAAIRVFVEAAERTNQTDMARKTLAKAAADNKTRPEVLMAVADGYITINDRPSAIEAAKLAVQNAPATPQARLAVVRALMLLDRMPEAETLLSEEIRKDSTRADLHFQMGQLCGATGRMLPAIDQLRQAVDIDRNNVGYRIALARALLDSGDLHEAGRTLETVDPANPTANVLRLQIKLIQGERVDMNQMLANGQGSDRSALSNALPYLAKGQLKQCVDFCEAELKKTPDDIDIRLLLGRALLALGEQEKGIAQWERVLQAAPDRLSTYLELASILSRDVSFEKVAERMARIPGAQQDMVELAIGRMVAASGDYDKACNILRGVANRDKKEGNREAAPEHVRGRARVLLAQSLAAGGKTDAALAEFDQLTGNPSWRKEALFGKAQLLAMAKQMDRFDNTLSDLRKIAQEEKDTSLLRNIAELYANNTMTDQAIKICDDLEKIAPNDSRTYRVRAAVLNLAGRSDEAILYFNKAIDLQPRNFSLYLAVQQIYALQDKSVEALATLKRLEENGPSARSIAMFQRGRLYASWGLLDKAAECFENLSNLGFGGNPQVRLALGQAFAMLGQKARATDFLRDIPSFSEEYMPAQLMLARMTPDQQTQLAVLRRLQESQPQNQGVLVENMNVLVRAGKLQEALAAYEAFVAQPKLQTLPEEASYVALQILLRQGQEAKALQLAQRAMKQRLQPRWTFYTALLSLDSDPAAAAALLPQSDKANFYSNLLSLYLARKAGNAAGQTACLNRVAEIFKQSPSASGSLIGYQLLIDVAMAQPQRAQADLKSIRGVYGFGRSVAAELANSAATNPKSADEALLLLKASVAHAVELPALSNLWAMRALQARPTCQWAAALAVISNPEIEACKALLSNLQPKDCALVKVVTSQILRSEQKYQEAADLLAQASQVDDTPEIILNQAANMEYAGKQDQALALYRKLYQASQDPSAANNVAYMILQLYPSDKDKLEEARALAEKAVALRPQSPDYCDTLGWIEYLQGKYEQACTHLRKSVKGMPQSPEVHYHLGMAESACGRLDLARWHLSAAVSAGKVVQAQRTQLTAQMTQAIQLAQKALHALGPAK